MNQRTERHEHPDGTGTAPLYHWEIHRLSDGRQIRGPSGTCSTEEMARACVTAALQVTAGPDVCAWGHISACLAGCDGTPPILTPLAWATPHHDGTLEWLPLGATPDGLGEAGTAPGPSEHRDLVSPLVRFGREMRRHRLHAHLTPEEIAERAQCTTAKVLAIENGITVPTRSVARHIDRAVSADGALVELWVSIMQSAYPPWFRTIVEQERKAVFIQEFESVAVPGLFQTEEYARALFTSANPMASHLWIEQFVVARLDRQDLLAAEEQPRIMLVLDESVFRRRVGGRRVMSEQLGHLLRCARLPRVHLQVLPFSVRDHPGGLVPFRVMGFQSQADVCYEETFLDGRLTSDPSHVQQRKLAFNILQAKALSQQDSQSLIRRIKEEME
ncbi:helix-turn-helix domain-containing protein [Thermomonospora amylolytica]|uniref:helix-turn-helix domain-containing protein n=1 Tax=Thermomonospora amylolytica TaxID=1411117 RepID=UPI000E6C1409|nr:helix-turn-helix transcriptional regulator [Thermomonospora amylolytica]